MDTPKKCLSEALLMSTTAYVFVGGVLPKSTHNMFSRRNKNKYQYVLDVNPSLAEHDMPCLSKQCRSRSVGF